MPEAILEAPKPAPPAPTPPPTPTPAPPPATPNNADDPFGALHSSIKAPAPAAPAAPVSDKRDAQPPKPAPSAPAPKPVQTGGPKELRAELDRVKGELQATNKAKSDLEAKIADYEAKGKDTTALVEQMKARDEAIEKLQGELRAVKHETAPEFKAKFDKPFNDAAALAEQDVKSMQVLNTEGVVVRAGTFEDLNRLWLTYKESPAKGIAEARALFGDDAQIVTDHLKELRRLDYARNNALAEEREQWKQKDEAERAQAATNRENISRLQKQVEKELSESVAEYHDPPEDKEASNLRNEGYKIFDTRPQTFQQHVIKQAHIRHAFAALGPTKLKLLRAESERDALKAKVEELEGKTPGGGKRGGGEKAPPPNESWEDATRRELLGT
jgi:hypothetical protein